MTFSLLGFYFCRPQQLELTAVNEIVLLDSINIFQMNGFDFEFQHNGRFFFSIAAD